MTAFERVRSTQRSLSVVVGGTALLWAGATLLGVLILGGLLGVLVALPPGVRVAIAPVALIAALGVLGYVLYRNRFTWSMDRVALWIEERAPELRYALMTAIDPRYAESMGPLMEPVVSRVNTGPFVRQAATRSMLPGLGALVVALLVFTFMPKTMKPASFGSLIGRTAAKPTIVGNRLKPMTATITAPGYSGLPEQHLTDPATLSGLQGSRVIISGAGVPDGITAMLQSSDTAPERQVPVVANGADGWKVVLPFTDSLPAALKFTDKHPSRVDVYTKLIVVDPRVDQPPTAKLLLPLRDTTLRIISGTLNLSADLGDDIGIDTAHFELTVAKLSESGDKAEATTTLKATRKFGGSRSGHFEFSAPFSSLGLSEGAILQVRAVVWDNNSLYGPGKGYSETRSIRIATKGEYDSIAVNPAPPSADTAMVSLRMLIIAVEKLDKLKPTMERKKFVDSSYKLAGQAETIKQKIQRILDDQTGGGEVDANPLLKIALDAMFDASRSLMIAETGESLPFLYKAYNALKEYTKVKRYYLRGLIQVDPVNIERIRLKGTEPAQATGRKPRAVEGAERERLAADYARAMQLLKTSPDSAVDVITLMRVETLRKYPELAAALGDAVTAIQAKKDPGISLAIARKVITGDINALGTLPVWSGAW